METYKSNYYSYSDGIIKIFNLKEKLCKVTLHGHKFFF